MIDVEKGTKYKPESSNAMANKYHNNQHYLGINIWERLITLKVL